MPDKKYLIEIPDMPDGSGVWDADKWERNKDAFMADYPDAQVFELGEYDEADSRESDQILLSFEDEASSGIWDQAKWERNKYAFTKDNPEAQVSRVRYVDYWGQKADANRAERASLMQPDEERNAKLAELGYYDDLSEGQRVFDVNAPSMIGLKPLSSAIDTNSVSGHTTYLDPRVQEFFANDSAYTDKMAEIARLDAEYDENPAVIAQREWEAQMLAEQKAYADNLEKEIKGNLESDVDMRKAARGGTAKRGYDSLESQQMSYLLDQIAGEEAGSGEYENEKLERYTTSLKFLEKAKIARDLTGKGFGGAVIDWGKEGLMDAGTQDDVEAYNEIGNILTRLEKEVGNLKEENLTEDVFDKYLSKDEQALIKSFFEYNKAMADAQQDMSRAYKGGKIFSESIPFMLEFLATGGFYKGAGRAATRGLERSLVKWVSKAARNTASRTARKIAAATARDLTYALVGTTARTLASPGTYERMAEASVEIEDGHLNRAKNAAIAAADMYVENLSEISGGLIGKTLGWAGKGVGKLIAKTPLSKVGGMLADNKLMQSISAFMPKLEALGFHGLPEEIGEEFIGNAIREVLNIQPGALKEMVSDDNFGAMLIGFAPMTLIGAAGGAISLGAINYEAAKLGNKMREMMSDHYSAEEMDAMMSIVQNAGTAEEIQQAIKPMALAIANAAERGMLTQEQAAEEIEMLYQWGGFMAQNKALLFSKKAQENDLANAKRAEMVDQYGRFWQEDETESVQVATLNNGSTVFVTSAPAEDGKITTIDVQTGKKGFANVSDIATQEVEGEQIQSSNKMTMDAFLNGQIAMSRKTAEETRMTNERNAQIDALRAEITPGTRINLGTEGSPVYVFAKKTSNNGVTIVDETGMESTLGWEQAADALGKPIIVETDQQKLDAEVSARLQRLAERRMQRNISPAVENATAEAAEESAEVVAQEQKHIPLNEDGTVNEAAFWTQDPEGYAEWNDEQNQDGGQDTLRQIAISKAEMFALLAEAQSRQNTSNPAARKAAEKEAAIIAEKIQRLQAMEMKYADALAEEKEAVKQTAATPTATMSEEQLEQMDTQYQGILGKTRIQSERVRVMQEYLNKLAEDSAPIRVLTKDNYEEVMRAEGCPEDDIKRVGKALNRKRGGQVAGFASNGVTFVMANTIADINSARITYIHERQHLLNSQNPEVVKQFAAALGDKENALRILETFVDKNGLEEYKNDSIERLADEIICRSMEIVYSTENYSVDLQNQGLSEEAINIINTIDNGQRTDKSLSSARRSSYVNGSRRENIEENGRNSEQVSGGILGEQETGSLGSSGRGDGLRRQGSTGEGAEVISEEQLNAPNSGTAQQITAADGEVLADTNGKGGVRFSIRTWNEGGRDYLAAWLANDAVLTEEEKADILARMDEFYKNALLYSDTYVPFGTWSDAEVRYDNEGNPLMSVVKANGDYAMNLDFSLVCKKRRPLNRLLRTLINRNAFGSYDLKEREIAEINWILQEHGFEVACALCFVDSKRYRVAGVADVFAKLWNNLVTSLAPNGVQIAHFNYNDNPNVEPVENGLDTLPDDQLNWKKLDKAVAKFKKGSVEYKVAQYLREHPEARKLVDATDFIEAEGFEAVKEANPDLLKFYNMKKGTGGPKASFGDVQYLNDILKSGKKFDAEKAYAVGGVRLQSFSDFVPHMYFDYMQLFAELAAKKLPLHAYTKEVLFAKIFGLTGAKINMSLVPAVVEGGVAPGLDAEGNYAWADPVTDAEGNVIQQGQSFPYDEAMAIQQTEGYSKNCGVIAVGISDAHIEKMMEDPNIPFIIPYHKSSLNAIVARMTNIDQYKDYTNVQNTRKASGSKLDKGTKDFNFNEYLHSLGKSGTPQQAAQAYLDWCRENKFIPKFSQFAYHPNYYKLLQDFNTIDLTTGEYAPQGAVTMTFPTEESAFGNVETLIQQGLQEDAALEEKMEQEIDGIADQVIARLEEIAKEPKMSDKQRVEKMAELADERMTKIKEQSGVIDLVEEAKKAVEKESGVSFRMTRTDEQRERLFGKAKERFGLTNNFNAAGYMLPDGSLLDFSEANDGGDPNQRSLDHREIEGIIMDEGKEYDSRWMYLADFMNEGAIRLLPEYAGINLMKAPTKEQRQKLFDFIYKYNGEVILEIADERLNNVAYVEYDRRTSPSRIFRDIDRYFNEGIVPQQSGISFRAVNDNQAIFVSNAAKAVEGIKQEKATPEQWLKMIEKNGGLKAGEDKWMGLSDWLKASDKKTLTKQEVLDFINENMIVIEEQHYSNQVAYDNNSRLMDEKYPGWRDAFSFEWDDYRDAPNADILDEEEAATLYNKYNEDKVEIDEDGEIVDDTDRNKVILWGEGLGKILFGLDGNAVRPIHDTREVYTTKGLINRHEIALTVPTIESWGKSDMIHFGDAGDGRAVAWIRFGETSYKTVSEDSAAYNESIDALYAYWDYLREKYGNGWADAMTEAEKAEEKRIQDKYKIKRANLRKNVLVIDEIQSKRHQEGREKGYRVADVDKWLKDSNVEVVETGEFFEFIKDGQTDRRFSRGLMQYDIEKAKRLYVAGYEKSDVPDAPFDKNWHELAMKRMLRYAAENGYDVIAWTKGEQQAERYGIGNAVSRIESGNAEGFSGTKKIVDIYAPNGVLSSTLYVNEDGKVVSGDYLGQSLSDIVGKEMAVKLMADGEVVIDGDNLRIGGEGMKGFYDRMLPAFMNKYGKKWGVKVEDIDLPNLENGLTMHSVPVTEEMKQSVMEGQVMFRIRTEEEDAMEFTQQVINDCTSRYNEVAEVHVFPENEETAERFGYTMEELKEIGGTYVKEEDIIAIFANKDRNDSLTIENIFFHESIHKLAEFYPEFKKIGEWMWDNSDIIGLQKIKNHIENGYDSEWYSEEMLTYGIAGAMSLGVADRLESALPEELQGDYRAILNEIGYEPGKESRRTESRVSESSRRGAAAMERKTDESGRSKKEEARTGELTAEERRVIGEYFPEFNKSEDVRYRISDVNTNPTEAQKKAGNYKKGHIRLDGYNITIENPKGSVRRGTDSKGNAWENTLNNDYGYIRGTEGVDGDHIDVYLSDNPTEGNVFVIDQVNPETREFDEHKVMYGFDSAEEAREAYLANFSEGWDGLGTITEVSKDEFKKWIESSHRKTKPFSEYKSVRANEMQATDESELRYRVVSDQETLDRLNSEPTIKVYRAMQLIDGKLYPPMSAKVDGELRQPIELGQWEEAEERPDLVDEKGRFKLDKGNKSSLKARYNPYFHTSPTPLNDQFSSAQTRPELVTVEVEVPESELTSGYKAEKAKDSVGKMEWKAGVVQSKLSGTRTVILSRWDKPVRIVPDSEVADVIVDMFEGRDITMPSNVVTPSLRAELEKRGVPFVETDNQGNPVEEVSFRVTGTPTDEVVANGLTLTPAQTAEVAANIFAALPEESRKKITDGLNGNILGLKDAILQIPASLATKENWDEEDIKLANAVRTAMQDAIDKQQATSRPLTTKEALWMLYDSTNTVKDLVDAASRAFVAHSLGFDQTSIQRKAEVDDYVRFRTASGGAIDAATDMYNYETSLWTERLKESWLDMNRSVISLQKAMAEASGMPIEPWENLEFALNRLSSKSYADKKKYLRDFLIPMWDTILDIVKHDHVSIEDIERYMMLKHGLERNKKFASRDAKEFYRAMYDLVAERMKNQSHAEQVVALSEAKKKLADIDAQIAVASSSQLPRLNEARARAQYDVDVADLVLRGDETQNEVELQAYYNAIDNEADPKYREFREKDYGGLTSMFVDTTDVKRSDYKSEEAYQQAVLASTTPRYDDVAAMESAAEREVSLFENKVYMYRALWDKVNAATKETLRHQYESGMITREQYEAVRDMFEFYVPLRGFADNTAEDMYSYYMTNSAGGFTKPILAAKGRKTRAESPLGWIGTMAESAIQADNKNEAKMCLYYATLRRPDQNLLAITETWYEYTGQKDANGKKIFKAVYPPAVSQALSADDLRQHMDTWEADMKQKQSRGEAYKGSQRVDLKDSVVFQDVKEEKEHIVRVKVAGQDYSILINGNPRAAQAINGLLNPDANVGPVAQWIGDARRSLSALLTSYSPLFWVANYQRDLLSSTMRVSEANGWNAAMKYLANRRKAWRVASYIYKYDAGTLGDSYYEKLYKEFADNGGVTGYTALTTNKEYENLLEKYANNVDKHLLNAVKGIWDKFIGFGEAIEQVSRFAAFITAREEGKSIEEAINAAKEVSVNFNRKGSAKPVSLDELDKLRTKDGKKLNKAQRGAALILSAMPGPMKFCYYFVNASIQALSSSVKLAKKSPGKATTWVGMYMGTSIALAMLNYLLSDDDDDEYLNLPDYLRHSTALVKVADGYYFKWSIPQEMRPFYAWADILVRKMMGKMPHKSGKDVGKEMALAASQWLPVNPFEAEDPLLSLIPDFASPLAEIKANTNAFGGKIYDDMAFKSEGVVKEIPAYRKATEKTGDIYVDISEFLNDVSGGDEVTKGMININPAIMEHLIEGYGGGIYDFAKMMVSIPSMILSDDPVQIKEIPFVNKVILSVDETNMYSHTNEAFFHYKDIADNAKRVEKEYRESDDPSRADDYQKEEDWRVYLLYKQYEADFKNVKERLDNAVDKEEEDLLKQEQNVLREMFLNDIAKGDLPEVTFQIREDIKRIDKEIKEAMKPVSDANKERLEKKNAGDVDGMLKAIEKRDSLKETPEYRKAEEMKADLKEIKRQLEELGTVTRSSQRDSVIGEIQKNYDALIRKRAEL